jgi:hypothetical protein
MNRAGRVALIITLVFAAAATVGAEVPAPAETLSYDDGWPESFQSLGDFMCELMPAPSVTPYPFDVISVLWNTSLTGSFTLQLWDDGGSGGLPGTVIHSQAVNPPASGWFEIPLSSPITITSGQFYVGCPTVQGIGFDETNPDFDEAYVDVGFGWEPFWYYGPNGDFLIRAVIEPTPLLNDVGVVEILSPDSMVVPGVPVAPEARVHNLGSVDQDTVPVWCVIDSASVQVYADTDTVFSLLSRDTTNAVFSLWTPDGPGNIYDVVFFTGLAGDEDSTNDTLGRVVETVMHDCSVDSIVEPPDTVYIDDLRYPTVLVSNYGNVPESLDVVCSIDSYVDTFSISSLQPSMSLECTLSAWQVPLADSTSYSMTAATLVPGDVNPSNDSLAKQVFAYNPHDVAVVERLNPPDTVWIADWPVQYTVLNVGEVAEESTLVACTIVPDGYADSVFVVDLQPGQLDTVDLADWWSMGGGGEICSRVVVPLDRNQANDTLCDSVFVYSGMHQADASGRAYVFSLSDPTPSPFA